MKQILKYLFFLVIGILIFILLNGKERFSVGIQPSETFEVFDPNTNRLFETTPIMKDQNLLPEQISLKHDLQEAIRNNLSTVTENKEPLSSNSKGILSVCKKLKDIRTTTGPNRVCLWVGLGYLEYLTSEYIEEEIIIICDSSLKALKYAQDSIKIHQALYPDSNKKFLFHWIDLSNITHVENYLLDIIRDRGFVVSLFNISNVLEYLSYEIVTALLNLFNTHAGVSEDMYWIINSNSEQVVLQQEKEQLAFTWYIHKADAVIYNNDTGVADVSCTCEGSSLIGNVKQNIAIIFDTQTQNDSFEYMCKSFMNRITDKLNKDTKILTKYSYFALEVNKYVEMQLARNNMLASTLGRINIQDDVSYGEDFFTNSDMGSVSTLQISKFQLYVKQLLEDETRYFNNCLNTWFNGLWLNNDGISIFIRKYNELLQHLSTNGKNNTHDKLKVLEPFFVYNQREIAYLAKRANLSQELLVKFILNPPSCFYAYGNTTLQELLDERPEYTLWRKRPGVGIGYNQRRFVLNHDRLQRFDGDILSGDIVFTNIRGLSIEQDGDFNKLNMTVVSDNNGTTVTETFELWAGDYSMMTRSNERLDILIDFQTKLQARALINNLLINELRPQQGGARPRINFEIVTSWEGDDYTQFKADLLEIAPNACSTTA